MNANHKKIGFRKAVSGFILLTFLTGQIFTPAIAQAQALPFPGTSIGLTAGFQPPVLLGLKIHPENPLLFDFIVDQGASQLSQDELKSETEKLVKYFLAALTIPDKEVWVNLSPYEKDRIIPDVLGQTTMGKTMLEQDYMLKQLASSLTNPDEKLGQEFWGKVKTETQKQLGTTDVPMNTFNKVWIVPQKAEVLESQGIVLVGEKRLKLMMDQDYVAMGRNAQSQNDTAKNVSTISSNIFKDTILPNIEKEINEGKNFANVRQIYNSVILAAWYKKALKESLLGKVYTDKGKVAGIETDDKEMKQRIYEQYLAAFKKGVYNVIKEEQDTTGDLIPRKYFSGGIAEFGLAGGNVLQVRAGSPLEVQNQLSASSGIHIAEVFTAEDRAGDGKAVFARAGSPLEEKIQELSAKIFNQDIVTTFRNYYGTKYYTADEVAARLNEYLNDFQSNIRKVVDDEADIDVVEKQLNKLMIHIRKQQFDYDIWIKEVKQQIPELRKIRAAEFPPGIFEFKRLLAKLERGFKINYDFSGEDTARVFGFEYGKEFEELYDQMLAEVNKSYKGRVGISPPGTIRIVKDILADNGLSEYRSTLKASEEFSSFIDNVEKTEMQVVVDARGDEVRRSYGFGKRFADYYDEFHDQLQTELKRRGGLYPDQIIAIAKSVLTRYQNNESQLFEKRFEIRRQQHAKEKQELANWRDEFDKALRFAVESTGTGLIPLSYKGDPEKELRQFANAENLLDRVQAFYDSYVGEFEVDSIAAGIEEARSTYYQHRATQTEFEQIKEYIDRVRLGRAAPILDVNPRGDYAWHKSTVQQVRQAYGYGDKFEEFYANFYPVIRNYLKKGVPREEIPKIMDEVFLNMMRGATVKLADTDNEVDYYATLGILRNASDDDMKKAYRKLAMKYHPDRNKGDQEAERKFKEINEANSILSNPTLRAVYDAMGHRAALQEMFEAMKRRDTSDETRQTSASNTNPIDPKEVAAMREMYSDPLFRQQRGWWISTLAMVQPLREKVVNALIAVHEEGPILSVGVGTGLMEAEMKAQRSDLDIHGVDILPELVELAAKKGINARQASGDSLPSDFKGKFSMVIYPESIEHLNYNQAMREANRVLGKNGKIVIIEAKVNDVDRRIVERIVDTDEVSAALRNNGFSDVKIDVIQANGRAVWVMTAEKVSSSALITGIDETKVVSAPTVEAPWNKGGIDFDPTNMNLQIKRDGKGVPLPLPQQNLEQINIQGLFPVIINIVPVNTQTLPLFLGKSVELPTDTPLLAGQNSG